jgi:hypothetical protein
VPYVGCDRSVAAQLQRGVVDRREPGEGQRGEHEPEVAQGDVVEAGVGEQADDDAGQPSGDDVGAVAGLQRDDDPGEISTAPTTYMNCWPLPGAMSLIQGAK